MYLGTPESIPGQKLGWRYRARELNSLSVIKDLSWPIILGREWIGYSALVWEKLRERPRTERVWDQLGNYAEGLEARVRRPWKKARR